MKKLLALCLISSSAFADPKLPPCYGTNIGQCVTFSEGVQSVCSETPMGPGWVGSGTPCPAIGDAPVDTKDSARLLPGWGAPFEGQLISKDEQLRREKVNAACKGELEAAKTDNVLVPKPAFIALAATGAAAIVASVVMGVLYAMKPTK
jgi:hypothetical protein